jgi:hypothetical protein
LKRQVINLGVFRAGIDQGVGTQHPLTAAIHNFNKAA